ncbi:MAG: M48 family metallopeptidase [Bacteroidota bacterium]
MKTPKKLEGLKGTDYQHPLDKVTLERLKNTRGLDAVVKKFYDLGIEKVIKMQHTGSALKATRRNFPKVINAVETACSILNVDVVPDIYITRSERLHATCLGVDHPIIVLSSESVNRLTEPELLFIIGREIGQIQNEHILYLEIGFIFPELVEVFSSVTLGLANIVSGGLRYALFNWSQMADYTADRAGFLACQDIKVVIMMLAKFAGLPESHWESYEIEDFLDQARSFEGPSEGMFEKVMRFIYGNNLWAVARCGEILKWIESGDYEGVVR